MYSLCFNDVSHLVLHRPAKELPPPELQTTVLPNGLRICSIDHYSQGCSIGCFIDTGTKYEEVHGICSHLEKMAFGSTELRGSGEMAEALDLIGANTGAHLNREQVRTARVWCRSVCAEHLIEQRSVCCVPFV